MENKGKRKGCSFVSHFLALLGVVGRQKISRTAGKSKVWTHLRKKPTYAMSGHLKKSNNSSTHPHQQRGRKKGGDGFGKGEFKRPKPDSPSAKANGKGQAGTDQHTPTSVSSPQGSAKTHNKVDEGNSEAGERLNYIVFNLVVRRRSLI